MSHGGIVVDSVTKEFRMHRETRDSLKERFVRGKAKGLNTFRALDDVSFSVPKGSTFGLIGHNGSGKSTMLKLLAGVYRPTSGEIRVDGRVSALLELGAGFHGELTGRENIRLNGAILGFSKREIERSMDQIIEFADIGDFIDVPVKVYSSGMYVRLGFAVAVTMDPEILIVDEIIAVGDEEFQRKCFDYLFKLRRRGVTIALVTHSMGLARELCDDAIWLEHGHKRALGPVDGVVSQYIAEVNRDEAANRGEIAAEEEDIASASRRGSGEARIRDIKILDANGEAVPFVSPGQDVMMEFAIDSSESISDAVVGMGIVTENGLFISGSNSAEIKRLYDIPRGHSTLRFELPSMPLQPGTYFVAASIGKKGHTFDYSEDAGQLVVRTSAGQVEPGYFRLQGDWGPLYEGATR
ncbi:ABC transporter ATP-binding protein [Actinomyces minihominis]|uniref:ABC transporter ATP-binding protein n=1 Tax=Actinomyces minihominis TaxID=2002838 RepID=UPI000C06B544|nr:ABC transporter ATP-binding protein [Actinomyces minihominis]